MEETKVPCGVCVKCLREAKAKEEERNDPSLAAEKND
jgi:hypothetical protein